MSLPRQSTADYLTGCTDPNERRFAPGRSLTDVPASPEALEAAFRSSPYASDMQLSLEKYKDSMDTEKQDQITFKEAVAAEKKRGVSKKSPYTVGFFGQVKALVKRNLQTRMQDKFTLVTSYTLTTVSDKSRLLPKLFDLTLAHRYSLSSLEAHTSINHSTLPEPSLVDL